jgi:hypothetical protein
VMTPTSLTLPLFIDQFRSESLPFSFAYSDREPADSGSSTEVWKVPHGTGTLTWSRFPFFHPITIAFRSLHIQMTLVRT